VRTIFSIIQEFARMSRTLLSQKSMTYKIGGQSRTRTEKRKGLSFPGMPIPFNCPLFGGRRRNRNESPEGDATLSRRALDPAKFIFQINTAMRLDEITKALERKLESHDWKSPREVMRFLRKQGYKQGGQGSFGAVFVHPTRNKIVKISKRQDVCWLRFAYWTLKMTSNPSVPYIDWVRVYGEGDKFFIAVVEKLAPFNKQAIMNTKDLVAIAYLYSHQNEWDINGPLIDAMETRLIQEGAIHDKNSYDLEHWKFEARAKKFVKTSKAPGRRFIRTLQSAQKFAKGQCSYDAHDGNLMYRPSDQSLVVIDPLADLDVLSW
jgi:hypothetical protein